MHTLLKHLSRIKLFFVAYKKFNKILSNCLAKCLKNSGTLNSIDLPFSPFCHVSTIDVSILRSIHVSLIRMYRVWIISKVVPPPKATLSRKPLNLCREWFFCICFLLNILPWNAKRWNVFVSRYRKKANQSRNLHGRNV